MKATIRADGFLVVQPETDLEAYALKHWARENLNVGWYKADALTHAKVIIDLRGFGNLAPDFEVRFSSRTPA